MLLLPLPVWLWLGVAVLLPLDVPLTLALGVPVLLLLDVPVSDADGVPLFDGDDVPVLLLLLVTLLEVLWVGVPVITGEGVAEGVGRGEITPAEDATEATTPR